MKTFVKALLCSFLIQGIYRLGRSIKDYWFPPEISYLEGTLSFAGVINGIDLDYEMSIEKFYFIRSFLGTFLLCWLILTFIQINKRLA